MIIGGAINILSERLPELQPAEINIGLLEYLILNSGVRITSGPEFMVFQKYKIEAEANDGKKYICFSTRPLSFCLFKNDKTGRIQVLMPKDQSGRQRLVTLKERKQGAME